MPNEPPSLNKDAHFTSLPVMLTRSSNLDIVDVNYVVTSVHLNLKKVSCQKVHKIDFLISKLALIIL